MAMAQQIAVTPQTAYSSAGWAAITSGVIGILAFAFLITAVTTRTTWIESSQVNLLFRAHDIGVILQFLLLAYVAIGLQKISLERPPIMSRSTLTTGVVAILFVTLLLFLGIIKVVNDLFYAFPQGIFGAWLIGICWRLSGVLPRWLRWFGMFTGLGLLIVGIVFPGLVFFVYPSMINIPAVSQESIPFRNTRINILLHQMLAIGSFMGVVTLPFWTILTGAKLLRFARNNASVELASASSLLESPL